MLDPVAVERAERSLDEFINSRSKAKDKANELEEAWAKSERKHRQRQREENREAWRCFYLEQAERLERTAAELAASHRARAAMLGEGVSVLEPSMSRDNAKGRAVFG